MREAARRSGLARAARGDVVSRGCLPLDGEWLARLRRVLLGHVVGELARASRVHPATVWRALQGRPLTRRTLQVVQQGIKGLERLPWVLPGRGRGRRTG